MEPILAARDGSARDLHSASTKLDVYAAIGLNIPARLVGHEAVQYPRKMLGAAGAGPVGVRPCVLCCR